MTIEGSALIVMLGECVLIFSEKCKLYTGLSHSYHKHQRVFQLSLQKFDIFDLVTIIFPC